MKIALSGKTRLFEIMERESSLTEFFFQKKSEFVSNMAFKIF